MKNQEKTSFHRQDKPPVCFNMLVQGVGFELPLFGDVSPRFVRFFAVSFPFFIKVPTWRLTH